MSNDRKILLEVKDLQVSVEGKKILNGLNLTVAAGEVHAIMGPNGSGKSTLAYVLAGRPGYTITSGTVHYLGHDLLTLAPEVLHFACGDGVARPAREHVGEGALARAVRSHDGVHLARANFERQAVEDLLALDADVQIVDREHRSHVSPPRLPE